MTTSDSSGARTDSGAPAIVVVPAGSEFVSRISLLAQSNALASANCKILTASDFESTRKLASAGPVDLIVLDHDAANLDTAAFARNLRGHNETERIHTVVVEGNAGGASGLLDAGADDVIASGATDDVVRSRIAAGLRSAGRMRRLEESTRWLAQQARTDALTGLANRREIDSRLEGEFARARRSAEPLSILMVDVDHFKAVNDEHGHAIGDDVLRSIASSMTRWLRRYDVAGRWGGEEFVVVLPSCGRDALPVIADRLRASVASAPVEVEAQGQVVKVNVTLSIGGATLDEQQQYGSASELIAAADAAVYKSKREGRNRVTVFRRVN